MFMHHLVEMGGFVLNHHWHGINVLSLLECALLAAVLCSLLALFAFRKSKRLAILSLAGALSFATAAYAVNTALSNLTASGALAGANLIYVVQTAGSGGVKATMTQVATFINSLFSGDATVASGGAITVTKTNGTAFGALATVTPGTGVAAALADNIGSAGAPVVFNGAGGTPSSLALANATGCTISGCVSGLGAGVAAALAIAPGTTGSFPTQDGAITTGNCLKWGPGVQDAGATCGGGSGSVTSVTPGGGLVSGITASCTQTAITVTGTLSAAECLNAQVGTSYAIADTDRGKLITGTNAASQAYSIAQAGAASAFANGWYTRIQNKGTGPLVITPTTSTICGGSTLTIYPGQTQKITSDGANYQCDGGTTGNITVSSQAGANYAFVSSNFGQLVNLSNASNQIPTLPQAGTTGFPAGWYVGICNQGAGTQTITPTTSTIGGASTFVLGAGSAKSPACITAVSDGANYQVVPDALIGTVTGALKASTGGVISQAACADLSNGTALCSTTPGTGVATAAASALSAAGGLTSTIASGTNALGTTLIASGACGTATTSTATNTASTDTIIVSFNGDPTAVTGYTPAAMLTIVPFPTSNTVSFKQCNLTGSGITPSALTINWRVVR